jgi:hypothetical protein
MDQFPGKPSKEQLESYFKMSRQYFDQIAKQYAETDKEYYNKMIAPFYGGFSGLTRPAGVTSSVSSAGVKIFAALGFMIAIMGVAVVIFVVGENRFGSGSDPDETETISQSVTSETTYTYSDTKTLTKDPKSKTEENDGGMSHYELGEKYFTEQEWDKAEEHYKQVQPGDRHYQEVKIKLMAIKQIKDVQQQTGVKLKNK